MAVIVVPASPCVGQERDRRLHESPPTVLGALLGGLAAVAPDRGAHPSILTCRRPSHKLTGVPVRSKEAAAGDARVFASPRPVQFRLDGGACRSSAPRGLVRDPLRMMRSSTTTTGRSPRSVSSAALDRASRTGRLRRRAEERRQGLRQRTRLGQLVGPFFDRGLMLLDFEEHHRHRRLMQQAFTRPRLAGYTAALGPAVAAGLDAWEAGPDFRVFPALKELPSSWRPRCSWAARPRLARRAGRGQRRLHRLRPGGDALVRLPIPGTRWGRALAGRRLLEDSSAGTSRASGPSGTRRATTSSRCCAGSRRGRLRAQRRRHRQPHDLPADGRPRHLDDHRDHDDAPPRRAPGVAAALPRGGGRPARLPRLDQLDTLDRSTW